MKLCEKNEARIKEIIGDFGVVLIKGHNTTLGYGSGFMHGLEEGAMNEREAFLELLNKYSVLGRTSIKQIDVEDKIKELEVKE